MNTLSDFLEFSPFDNKVSAEFLRDIPDIIIESGGTIDKEKIFWDKFFVEYSIVQYKSTIDNIIESVNENNKHYILFIGPSGSGKTTFLNYLIKEKNAYFSDDLQIDMVNLIKDPANADIGSVIIHENLNSKIIHYLNKDVVNAISNHIVSYEKREKNFWNVKWLVGNGANKYDKHDILYNFIRYNRRNYSTNAVRKLCLDIDNISDKIALYFISFIMNKCIDGKKPCLFIFDNLDELDQEYLIGTLNLDLLSAFSKAQDFFEKIVLDSTYPFLSKCTTLESIRRNFVATVNSTQFKERVERSSITIKFDSGYVQNVHDIIDKRAKLHFSTNKDEIIKNKLEYAKQFNISIIDKEDAYIKRLCQLFNLDYRTTLSSLSYALNMDIYSWGSNAEQDNDCKLGVRGFLLFNILKYRLKSPNTRFEKYVKEELSNNNNGCNKYRMFFSILAKMYADIEEKQNQKKKSDVFHVSLLQFTDRIKEWYENVTVQSIYEALFVSGYHNYSLPANLEGETITNYIREKKYDVTLQSLCDHLAKLYQKDKDSLGDVDIAVNPLCLAYSQHVFIHYEYFNILSVYDENSDTNLMNAKSLFQQETLEEIKLCTKRVYELTNSIIKKADDHLCMICKKRCNEETRDCGVVIKKIQDHGFLMQDNMLYTTRVITSHINYLDSFRKLLWNTYHDTDKKKNSDMQKYLLSLIKDYVGLFRNKIVKNESANAVFKTIEENLGYANNNGHNVWTPISIGVSYNSNED